MATTTARNKQDVDNMNARDRTWDSLNYSYGVKREASDKSYDQAYSQADRQLLSRGMQRSSYGAQTLANISKQKIDAQQNIYDQQIADYENRLYQIERDEVADNQWQMQFDEGVRQFDTNLAYQQERAAVADKQWQTSFDEGVRQFNVGQGNTEQSVAYNYVMGMLQNGQMPSDDLLAKAGLSRADAQKLMAQPVAAAASSGSRGSGTPKPTTDTTTTTSNPQDLINALSNYGSTGVKMVGSTAVYEPALKQGAAKIASKSSMENQLSAAVKKAMPTTSPKKTSGGRVK